MINEEKIISVYGCIFTDEDIDSITNSLMEYYRRHPGEKVRFTDGDDLISFIGETFSGVKEYTGSNISYGEINSLTYRGDVLFENPENMFYFYILPLDYTASLFYTAYKTLGDAVKEMENKLKNFMKFLPAEFNVENHLVYFQGLDTSI